MKRPLVRMQRKHFVCLSRPWITPQRKTAFAALTTHPFKMRISVSLLFNPLLFAANAFSAISSVTTYPSRSTPITASIANATSAAISPALSAAVSTFARICLHPLCISAFRSGLYWWWAVNRDLVLAKFIMAGRRGGKYPSRWL